MWFLGLLAIGVLAGGAFWVYRAALVVRAELGDVLFTVVNLARHLDVDAEGALTEANARFVSRFEAMSDSAGGSDALADLTAEELEALWRQAKRAQAG